MSTKPSPPFRTNPSAIARYFFHDCERFLFYRSATPEHRKRLGLPEPEFDGSPLVEAVLESGYQWEKEVVEQLLRGRVVVAPGSGALHTRRLTSAETMRHLRSEPAGRYLYQPTLAPPRRFYDAFDIDPKLVVLSDNHPDLIQILNDEAGGRLLRVIDLKRGEALKLTHRVQILLYALELQALLDDAEIRDARVDLGQGAVWLGKQPEPELFDLGCVPAASRTLPAARPDADPLRQTRRRSLAPLPALRVVRVLRPLPRRDAPFRRRFAPGAAHHLWQTPPARRGRRPDGRPTRPVPETRRRRRGAGPLCVPGRAAPSSRGSGQLPWPVPNRSCTAQSRRTCRAAKTSPCS